MKSTELYKSVNYSIAYYKLLEDIYVIKTRMGLVMFCIAI